VLTPLFGAAGVVYATVIGVLVVVFAEVMPKTSSALRADRVA
jgi:Mg2+/Co2+ transporter CorB